MVALPAKESPSEQVGPSCLPLCGAEHAVVSVLPELRCRSVHAGLQPELSLQAAAGDSAL